MSIKIPILDEVIRSIQCLGDVITGQPEVASARWANWTEDSYLAGLGKTVGHTVAAGACAIVGQSNAAHDQITKAGRGGEQFGATWVAAVAQAEGVALQCMTYGVPNPASGAIMEAGGRFAAQVDHHAAQEEGFSEHFDFDHAGREFLKGFASGSATVGGKLPYAATAIENAIEGKEQEFDHGQEWGRFGIEAVTSAATAGAGAGLKSAYQAGTVGFKTVVAGGAAAGGLNAAGGAFGQAQLGRDATIRKLERNGYNFLGRQKDPRTGCFVDVYGKDGAEEEVVPCVDVGACVGGGLLGAGIGGVSTGIRARSEAVQNMRAANKALRFNKSNINPAIDTQPAAPFRATEAWRESPALKARMSAGTRNAGASTSGPRNSAASRTSAPASTSGLRNLARTAAASRTSGTGSFVSAQTNSYGTVHSLMDNNFVNRFETHSDGKVVIPPHTKVGTRGVGKWEMDHLKANGSLPPPRDIEVMQMRGPGKYAGTGIHEEQIAQKWSKDSRHPGGTVELWTGDEPLVGRQCFDRFKPGEHERLQPENGDHFLIARMYEDIESKRIPRDSLQIVVSQDAMDNMGVQAVEGFGKTLQWFKALGMHLPGLPKTLQ